MKIYLNYYVSDSGRASRICTTLCECQTFADAHNKLGVLRSIIGCGILKISQKATTIWYNQNKN